MSLDLPRLLVLSVIVSVAYWTAAADAQQLPVQRREVSVVVTPIATEPDGSTHQASENDIIWSQRAAGVGFATLQTGIHLNRPVDPAVLRVDVAPSEPLFEVRSRRGLIFCSFSADWKMYRDETLGSSSRACFIDDDSDGQFEAVSSLTEVDDLHWVAGGFRMGNTDRDPSNLGFGGTMLFRVPVAPLAYERVETANPPTSTIGIQMKRGRFTIVGIASPNRDATIEGRRQEGSYIETDKSVGLPNRRQLPAVVTLLGAQIEVTERTDNGVAYRVVSGFPAGSQLDISLRPF